SRRCRVETIPTAEHDHQVDHARCSDSDAHHENESRGQVGESYQGIHREADLVPQAPLRRAPSSQYPRDRQANRTIAEPVDQYEDRRALFIDPVDVVDELAIQEAEVIAE